MDKTGYGSGSAPAGQSQDAELSSISQDSDAILVYTTFPSRGDAKKAAHELVKSGLAACVNIFDNMTAIYAWEGSVEEDTEVAAIIKTTKARSDAVLAEIERLHPYSTPARILLPVVGGGKDFLNWIAEQCWRGRTPS